MPDDSSVDIGVNLGIDEPSYKVVVARIKKLQSSIARLNAKPRADFTDKDAQKLKAYNTELEQTIALRDKLAAETAEQVEKSITDGYGVGEFFDVSLPEEAGIGQFFDVTVADDFVQKIEEIPQAQEEVIEKNEELGGGVSSIQDIIDRVVEFGVKKLNQLNGAFGELFEDLAAAKDEDSGGSIFGDLTEASGILSNAFKGLLEGTKRFFNNIKKNSDSTVKSFRRIGLALLGVRGVFTAVRKATNAYMAQNEEAAARLESIWVALGNAIGPIIEYLIKLITTAFGYINSFVKALTGIDMVANANAKALENQAKATKEATSEQKRQLAAFDEMNKLSDDSGSSSGSSKGPTLMEFPTFDVDTDGLGADLADRINKIFAEIDWDKIKEFISNGMLRVTTELNNFIATLDWGLLGETFANGFNTIINAGYIFVTNFDWATFGAQLAIGLSTFLATVDWEQLGATLIGYIQGLISIGIGYLLTFDWSTIGKMLGGLIRGIFENLDFTWIVAGLYGLVNAIYDFFSGLFEALGFNETTVKVFAGIATAILVVMGALVLLGGAIKVVSTAWAILSGVIALFKLVFGGLFNPTTILIALIVYLVNSLIKAATGFDVLGTIAEKVVGWIKDKWKGIGDWFKEKFGIVDESGKDAFESISDTSDTTAESLESTWETSSESMSSLFNDLGIDGSNTFADLSQYGLDSFDSISDSGFDALNDLKLEYAEMPSFFSKTFSDGATKVTDAFSDMSTGGGEAFKEIKNVFGTIPNWFENTFSDAWTKVKEVFSTGGQIFLGIKEGIENSFKTIVNKLISGINTLIAWPFNKINSMLNSIRNISFLGISPFAGLWGWNPVYVPQIPYLAQGAVIPPNKEFMAILGDQKQGTNIEAPLDTIKQALREVQDENQVQPTPVYFNVDGKTFAKAMIKWEKKLEFNFNG